MEYRMKTVIAIDSFKGSMTSMEAGNAAAAGVKAVFPDAEIVVRPLADGGEGTVEALTTGMGGHGNSAGKRPARQENFSVLRYFGKK